eukprot:7506585-Alexandrium_andersonii.AAC.1
MLRGVQDRTFRGLARSRNSSAKHVRREAALLFSGVVRSTPRSHGCMGSSKQVPTLPAVSCA